jgi:hypothetical protein
MKLREVGSPATSLTVQNRKKYLMMNAMPPKSVKLHGQAEPQ